MLLESILKGQKHTVLCGRVNIVIKAVEQDSRKIVDQALFIAIKGFATDGHKYIDKAVELGANAIVLTEYSQALIKELESKSMTVLHVENDREAMSRIASNFNGNPSEKLKMIGITGTNGKTSTSRIISDLLNASNVQTGLLGTIANEIGGKSYASSLTTPEPIELHNLLNKMVEDRIQACVMEASSHALDLNRVDDVQFDFAIFTNLTEDHLDYHPDFEAYYLAKSKLFALAQNGNLINIDDTYGCRLYEDCKALKTHVYSYGIDKNADFSASQIEYRGSGSSFIFETPGGSIKLSVPLPGKIYVYNTLAAFGLMYLMGMTLDQIKQASAFINHVPGRMELVDKQSEVRVFVDYAHTPDALSNALDIVRGMTEKEVITVFGCGGDRDTTKRQLMGAVSEQKSDKVIVTSDNPRTENPEKIIADIMTGIQSKEDVTIIADRSEAIGKAIQISSAGDVVLIAGKGHETYQDIQGVKYDFDDRVIAREYLNEKK